jgi:hypothetical protein
MMPNMEFGIILPGESSPKLDQDQPLGPHLAHSLHAFGVPGAAPIGSLRK